MISEEKPDLVIVTGDIAYPVPFQAGTFNNKNSAMLFADLMEQLGVYWCLAFGNHDTELYSYYTREQIAELYENKDKYPHCIFQSGPEDVDGVGNYAVNVKNSNGDITQSFIMFDSHSYTDNDYFGILWKYDCIHKNQIEWYKEKIASLTEENNGVTPKSLAFFHIPLIEMQQAYYEYRDNGFQDTDDVKYLFGKIGEKEEMICSSAKNEGLFDAMLEVGSTQGVFFGHDHLNNMSLNYKGIQLTYTYSIDYLAYSGIAKYGLQRGCTLINVSPDGEFEISQENYYQDKYQATNTKEEVTMADYRDYE
jgi:3',5'-cyclic AMP phosphodiesterase CpdA